jgi:hypothetical protein
MKHKPALYALVRLYSEIAGKIKNDKAELAKLKANLAHVAAVIHLLEPAYNLRNITPKRVQARNPWFNKGECLHHALDVLRLADKPLSARQIAIAVLQKRGVHKMTLRLVRLTTNTIYMALKGRRGKSVIAHDDLVPVRWSLSP